MHSLQAPLGPIRGVRVFGAPGRCRLRGLYTEGDGHAPGRFGHDPSLGWLDEVADRAGAGPGPGGRSKRARGREDDRGLSFVSRGSGTPFSSCDEGNPARLSKDRVPVRPIFPEPVPEASVLRGWSKMPRCKAGEDCPREGGGPDKRPSALTPYAAETKREPNAADGRLGTACTEVKGQRVNSERGVLEPARRKVSARGDRSHAVDPCCALFPRGGRKGSRRLEQEHSGEASCSCRISFWN